MVGGCIDSPKKMFEAIREIGFCHLGDVQASDELEAVIAQISGGGRP